MARTKLTAKKTSDPNQYSYSYNNNFSPTPPPNTNPPNNNYSAPPSNQYLRGRGKGNPGGQQYIKNKYLLTSYKEYRKRTNIKSTKIKSISNRKPLGRFV